MSPYICICGLSRWRTIVKNKLYQCRSRGAVRDHVTGEVFTSKQRGDRLKIADAERVR